MDHPRAWSLIPIYLHACNLQRESGFRVTRETLKMGGQVRVEPAEFVKRLLTYREVQSPDQIRVDPERRATEVEKTQSLRRASWRRSTASSHFAYRLGSRLRLSALLDGPSNALVDLPNRDYLIRYDVHDGQVGDTS